MKWATRRNLGLNRPPCIWLIRKFIDKDAEITLCEPDELLDWAREAKATSFHAPGADLAFDRENRRTTMDAFLDRYELRGRDPALDMVAEVINDASFRVPEGNARHPVAYGIRALNQGFRASIPDDDQRLRALEGVYESLYRWCEQQIAEAAV